MNVVLALHMHYPTLVVWLHVAIFLPSLVYLIFYMGTRRKRPNILDIPLVGTPAICVLFTARFLLIYQQEGRALFEARDLTHASALYSISVLFVIGMISWGLLFALYLSRKRKIDYSGQYTHYEDGSQ